MQAELSIKLGGANWQKNALEGIAMVFKTGGTMASQKKKYQTMLDNHPNKGVRERAFWMLKEIEKYSK